MNFLRKIPEAEFEEKLTPLFGCHLKELRTEAEKIGGRELAHMIYKTSSEGDRAMTIQIMDQILQKSRTKEEIFTYRYLRDGVLPPTLHQASLLMIACALKKEDIALFLLQTPFHSVFYERPHAEEPTTSFTYAFQNCLEEVVMEILSQEIEVEETGEGETQKRTYWETIPQETLFQKVCQKHMKRVLTYLVAQGILYPTNTNYAEVLYMGDEKTALKMIQTGEINPFYIDRRGKSPLMYCIEKRMMKLFEYYVEECPLSHFSYGSPSPVEMIKAEPPSEMTRAMRAFIGKRYKEPPRFIIVAGEHTIVVNRPMGKQR
jgi:hypothetical protein